MSTLFAEPVSPTLDYDEDQEPELEGLRNLSVSTDGTLDSLDENPTPPHSPTPIVHISPPGAKFPLISSSSRVFAFEDSVFSKSLDENSKKPTLEPIDPLFRPRSPFFASLPSYSDIPSTPPAVKLAFPSLPSSSSPPPAVTETLAERRASLGKLSNRALLSLQQMKFESSEDAGMGLGVGPPSAGIDGMEELEAISPGKQTGKMFQLAMGIDNDESGQDHFSPSRTIPKSPLLAAPGIENDDRQLQRSRSTGSLRRPRSRSSIRTTRPYSVHSPSSPTAYSPSSPRTPASPIVQRSSAFVTNAPLTPLTPSHVPGAPSLGDSGSAFEFFSFSAPESPVSPSFGPVQQKLPQFDQFLSQPTLPLTPTSDSGSITPTATSEFKLGHQRGTSRSRLPASPLGRGRFDEESETSKSNPFFAA